MKIIIEIQEDEHGVDMTVKCCEHRVKRGEAAFAQRVIEGLHAAMNRPLENFSHVLSHRQTVISEVR